MSEDAMWRTQEEQELATLRNERDELRDGVKFWQGEAEGWSTTAANLGEMKDDVAINAKRITELQKERDEARKERDEARKERGKLQTRIVVSNNAMRIAASSIVELSEERDKLRARLDKVLAIHRPGNFLYEYVIGHKFNACLGHAGKPVPHPCDTAIAAGATDE